MTTFRVNMAMSVDGFIADEKGGVDWLSGFDAADFGFDDFLGGIEAIACGAATYEQILSFDVAWPYGNIPFHVLASRPLAEPSIPSVIIHREPFETFRTRLESLHRGDVWLIGGGRLMRSFLESGAMTKIELYLIPILLGSGIPVFSRYASSGSLRLMESQQLSRGVVRLEYHAGRRPEER